MKNKIVVLPELDRDEIVGRLCNKMFEISNAIAYANRYGYEVYIKTFGHTKYFPNLNLYYNEKLMNNILNDEEEKKSILKYKEPNFHYDPILSIPEDIEEYNKCKYFYPFGFFQSYKYFDDQKEYIKNNLFKFSQDVIEEGDKFLLDNNISKDNLVSLQVRRGDILKGQRCYGAYEILTLDNYYNKGIEIIEEKVKNKEEKENIKYIVFSDSIDLVEEEFIQGNMGNNGSRQYIFYKGKDIVQLYLQTQSKIGNIIGASTFGWWGAYLNINKDIKVICPNKDKWFGYVNKNLDIKDLYPTEWEQI